MLQAHTKLTSQGQVSVPAAVRHALGLKPGSLLEWAAGDDGQIIVKRAARCTTQDVHQALFGGEDTALSIAKTSEEMKQGIRVLMQRKHAGR